MSDSENNIDISDSDISESAPTVSKKEKVSSKISGFRSGASKRLDDHKASQEVKREEKFKSRLAKLGKDKEEEESKLSLSVVKANRQELEEGSRAKVRNLQQKDQQPSFLDRLVSKTLTNKKPVKVKQKKIKITPKKKVKITKKNKKVVKKRKSKVKVSKQKTITIKLS